MKGSPLASEYWILEEEATLVPVGHKCGDSVRRTQLTVHKLPVTKVWYLVLVQAYLE